MISIKLGREIIVRDHFMILKQLGNKKKKSTTTLKKLPTLFTRILLIELGDFGHEILLNSPHLGTVNDWMVLGDSEQSIRTENPLPG